MPKTSLLAQLALAGIAAGLVSATPAQAVDIGEDPKPAAAEKKTKKAKKDSVSERNPSAATPATPAVKAVPASESTAATPATPAVPATPAHKDSAKVGDPHGKMGKAAGQGAGKKHSCRGMNECKGRGGCAMTKKDIEAAAKKMGIPVEKAGKAHACKGMNECKGLGGCNM